jgi:maltose O-acetyltransferase
MSGFFAGVRNRVLQQVARSAPGARSIRPLLHKWRGVTLGQRVWIGYDCVLETSRPHLIRIGNDVVLSIRVLLVAHFHGQTGITLEDEVFVGPGAIILPGVTIGKGAVVTAGSVVSTSVPPRTVVQGNPARAIATSEVSLTADAPIELFYRSLRPIRSASAATTAQ